MIHPFLMEKLVCPRSKSLLYYEDGKLVSENGYTYPIIQGIPVMISDDGDYTHPAFRDALKYSDAVDLETTNFDSEIDKYVQEQVAATSGNLYAHLVGNLKQYPIPESRITPQREGEVFLDVGCNWGRWSIGAARSGYRVIGIDPNLEALLAAKRVCQQLGIQTVDFVAADARYLPFASDSLSVNRV